MWVYDRLVKSFVGFKAFLKTGGLVSKGEVDSQAPIFSGVFSVSFEVFFVNDQLDLEMRLICNLQCST